MSLAARWRSAAGLAAVLGWCTFFLCTAASAGAYIYFGYGDNGSTYIGRSDTDGVASDATWLKVPLAADGFAGACGIAAASSFLYWANCNGGSATTIGRANIQGTAPDNNFISGASNPCGVAVSGSFIYWVGDGGSSIGRANIDGTGVNQDFITTGADVCSLAVQGPFIYWLNYETGVIGRANLDGTGVEEDYVNIKNSASGLAANSSYLYYGWKDGIGRVNLKDNAVQPGFLPLTNLVGITAIAVDKNYIYWANSAGGTSPGHTIGRANLDGSGVDPNFIRTPDGLFGLAVDELGPQPALGRRVAAQPVGGTVQFQAPGSRTFKLLTGSEEIPVGSTVNATTGTVELTAATGHGHATRSGQFSGGEFKLAQSKRGLTELTLTGGTPCASRASTSSVHKAKRKKQALTGNANGGMETIGTDAAAIGIGTQWKIEDTCSGTAVHATQGVVRVTDFVRHRTFLLHTPHSYHAGH